MTELEGTGTGEATAPDLDRLIKLFTGPNSATLHDRHIASIERLCGSPQGFALKDLPKVQQILELTFELLRTGATGFQEPACKLIRALGKPFVKKAATDEFKLLGSVENILKAVGKAFDPGFPSALQLDAAETLRSFATAHGPRLSALDLTAALASLDAGTRTHQYQTNQGLIVSSGVARAVIRGLATSIMVSDETLLSSLSATLLSFSYLPANCSQLVEMGVFTCLPHLLDHGYRHEVMAVAIELLWNLLEKAPEAKQQVVEPQPPLAQLVKATNAPTFQERQSRWAAADAAAAAANGAADTAAAATAGDGGQGEAEQQAEAAERGEGEGGTEGDAAEAQTETGDREPQGEAGGTAADGADASAKGSANGHGAEDELSLALGDWSQVYERLASSLSGLFLAVLGQGFREADKELRNNVGVVLTLVLDASPDLVAAAHEAGLTAALLAVACAPEVCNGAPHVKPWALTTDELDLELKLLCWAAATTCAALLPEALDASKDAGFVSLLLQYMDVASPPPAVQRWNADRLSSLRSAALTALHRIAPLSIEQYLAHNGVAVMLALLCNCPVPIHVEGALRHLHVLCLAAPEMAEALGAAGAMAAVLDLVQGTTAAWPEGLRQAALQLMAALCAVNVENQRRLRKAQGITALLAQLSGLASLDLTLPSPFVLAVLDAVWSCVVPDRKNVALFLVGEGMDQLLNLMERGNRAHRPLLLSLLTDLLENAKAHAFFHDWRSDRDQQPAAHLLIGFWKEEDSLRGMTVGGVLSNTSHPLRGMERRTCWVPHEEVVYGNMLPERRAQLQAITEACSGEQMLAKIYSVFKVLGMGSLSYVSLEDQAQLCLIEKYVKFKQGEVWRQIKDEFEAEGMRPTYPDRERLASGIELAEHLAHAVKDAQQQVLDRHKGTIKQQETKFFEDMKAQKKYEQEMRFFQGDKGLNVAEIREAKRKKEQMLKNSITLTNFSLETTMESGAVQG